MTPPSLSGTPLPHPWHPSPPAYPDPTPIPVPTRPRRPCTAPNCPALVPSGETRCPAHQRPGWRASPRPGSTRRWRAQRQQVLTRDDYRCRHCGAPATTVDHIHNVAAGGAEVVPDSALQSLCRDCHNRKTAAESRRRG